MPVDINATLELIRKAQADGIFLTPDELRKAGITTGTGLVAYDLRGPALSLIPVITPIRNRLPRVPGKGGTAIHWKGITGINTAQLPAGVTEGRRSGVVSTSTKDYLAAYKTIGLEDSVTFEADLAGQGFQDAKATSALNLLRAVMIAEEQIDFGGNTSFALGTTPTPTLTASGTGGSIATGTASVICVALTPDGYRRASLTNGVVASITRTNADGTSDTVGGGAAQKSAAATVAVTGPTGSVAAIVAAVPGAVGYAWYIGAAGTERLAAITTINSAVLTAYPASSQLASALPAADNSTDSLVYDGLLTYAFDSATNGGYFKALATGTAGTGSVLTSDGAGGIVEFTDAFTYFWNTYKVWPSQIWCAAQEIVNITKKVVANGGAPMVRVPVAASGADAAIASGYRVESILNPITNRHVKIDVHPNATPGTVLFEVEEIPYPLNGVRNVKELDTRRDYQQIDWPLKTRAYEMGVYFDGVLRMNVPFAGGAITNIANG